MDARIVFVGNGSPAQAAHFAMDHAGEHPVFSDAARATYRAAGMRKGLFATLHWRTFANAWRAFRNGFRQTKVEGSALQQGGVVVFGAQGQVLYLEADAAGGDELDLDAVLAAVRASSVTAPKH
ncbi:MAG: AhpC/TSA family protein [Planctomycetes bacterium]|jgi:hypothetical protein|nr:AhpC/TSA family protein [Planctomycetota bacterium]MCC7065520.1 AhpC/TSA family protein [Planctomycetota bacterium]